MEEKAFRKLYEVQSATELVDSESSNTIRSLSSKHDMITDSDIIDELNMLKMEIGLSEVTV